MASAFIMYVTVTSPRGGRTYVREPATCDPATRKSILTALCVDNNLIYYELSKIGTMVYYRWQDFFYPYTFVAWIRIWRTGVIGWVLFDVTSPVLKT